MLLQIIQVNNVMKIFNPLYKDRRTTMKCPHCNVNLVMSEKQGIEIDYCPECRGIWLDRGELEKIIEKSTQSYGEPQRSQAYNDQHHYEKQYKHGHEVNNYDHYGDNRHHKKSFLQEIFDFG
jgi:uncharacterized protein